MGHSRSMHGRHQTLVPRMTGAAHPARASGEVRRSLVAPNMATTGAPTAPARCIAPESFETTADAPASTAVSSASEVRPLKSVTDWELAPPASRAMAWHVAASARLPTSTTV